MSFTCRSPPAGTVSGRTARTAPCASFTTISATTSWPVTSVSPTFTRKPVLRNTGTSVSVVPAPAAAAGRAAGIERPKVPPRTAVVAVWDAATTDGGAERNSGP